MPFLSCSYHRFSTFCFGKEVLQTWVLIWKCHFTGLFGGFFFFFLKPVTISLYFKIKAPTWDVVIIKNIEPEGTLGMETVSLNFCLE